MVASHYNPSEEQKAIWIYLEQESGVLENVSLELLAKGRQMADQMEWRLIGLILGNKTGDLVEQAFTHGADEIRVADHPLLENYTIDAYARLVYQAILVAKPSVFLLGATPNGRDLAGRLAVRLRTGLNADCTGLRLEPESGVLVSEVSGFGGGVLALIEMRSHRPQMATVRPGVFEVSPPNYDPTGETIHIPIDLTEDMIHTRVVEKVSGEQVDLSRAALLVAGGRGVEGNFKLLGNLANLLDGEVGATRPPVDEGHIQRERQIGQTGVVCSPKVAICCGISGAFHFVVGVEKAETVIAINTDPAAPIFEFADYNVVGDVHEIVPALIEAIRERKNSSETNL